MKVAGGGLDPCYNAQAAVANERKRVLATTFTQAGNDKVQVKPMLTVITTLPALHSPRTCQTRRSRGFEWVNVPGSLLVFGISGYSCSK